MKHFTYQYGALSDPGDRRAENQDSILCCTEAADAPRNPDFCEAGLFLVADGMGGLSYGSQVSSYAAEQFHRWWNEDFPQMIRAGRTSGADIRELLEQEIWDINNHIYEFKEREGCRCGSTISVLLLYKGNYYIENLGDSRIYRFRKRKLEQLTRDQSLAEQLLREQKLNPEDVEAFPQKHVLTMCLGMFPVARSEFETGKLEPGDCFLLCSDGFHGYTEENWLRDSLERLGPAFFKGKGDLQIFAEWMRSQIPCGEAGDNVSLILIEIGKSRIY